MYIQYIGFNVAASSRLYNFDVIDAKEAREFSVKVQSEAFRPSRLRAQDGPSICFERLKQELEAETEESRTGARLSTRLDRKSTRLNSSHRCISYAVFCLKKKRTINTHDNIAVPELCGRTK